MQHSLKASQKSVRLSVLFLQRVGDGAGPGGDGIPVPEVADRSLDALDDQLFGQVQRFRVKQKVSGAFRTGAGAETFSAIRSYISTVRKNRLSVIDVIYDAWNLTALWI